MMVVFSVSSQSMFRASALPAWSSYVVSFLGSIRVLLITKATPAVARGALGSIEKTMFIFFPYIVRRVSTLSWSRCVSWSARIAIRCLFIVWLIIDHFSRCDMLFEGAAYPFIFRVVMFIFALSFGLLGRGGFVFTPGLGGALVGACVISPDIRGVRVLLVCQGIVGALYCLGGHSRRHSGMY